MSVHSYVKTQLYVSTQLCQYTAMWVHGYSTTLIYLLCPCFTKFVVRLQKEFQTIIIISQNSIRKEHQANRYNPFQFHSHCFNKPAINLIRQTSTRLFHYKMTVPICEDYQRATEGVRKVLFHRNCYCEIY